MNVNRFNTKDIDDIIEEYESEQTFTELEDGTFEKDRRNPLIPYIPKKLQVPWKLPALFLIQTMFFILKLYQKKRREN